MLKKLWEACLWRDNWKEGFWARLKKNHPLVYEATQWMILAIAILAIIINIIKIVN